MNTTPRVRVRGPLRTTALSCAALMSSAALLFGGLLRQLAEFLVRRQPGPSQRFRGRRPGSRPCRGRGAVGFATKASRLALAMQSIVYTASLTVRAKNVTAAAARATSIVTANGGYVASEQAVVHPRNPPRSTVSLQLKIPVADYAGTLRCCPPCLAARPR